MLDAFVVDLPAMLGGAATTLTLCAAATLMAIAGSVPLLALRLSGRRSLRLAAAGVLAVVRGLPLLIVLYLIFFGLPSLTGWRIPAFLAGVLALGLNGSAFMAEVLRGAIAKLDPGQFEAARALALPRRLAWRKIMLPQLVPIVAPAFVGEVGFLIKASPIVSLITVVDVTRRAQQIAQQTFDPLTPLLAAALIYFLMIGSLSWLSRHLERRLSGGGRPLGSA